MPTIAPPHCSVIPLISCETLEVWSRCENAAAALQAMRLVDDTGRLIRAPEVRFSSEEIGLDQFGYNIQNRVLLLGAGRPRDGASQPDPVRRRGRCDQPRRQRCRRSHGRWQIVVCEPRGRRRRAAVALPQGGRYRGQPSRPPSGGADLQHRPFATASEYLDRVPYPAGAVRFRAAARRPLQRGVGGLPQAGRAADGA